MLSKQSADNLRTALIRVNEAETARDALTGQMAGLKIQLDAAEKYLAEVSAELDAVLEDLNLSDPLPPVHKTKKAA